MYAIIDVETTGGNPKNNRITEIAIFIHDGNSVVDQFSTLINPGEYISPFITALTGITNEMVVNAPAWEEVAEKINELTEGKVFIAHNVRFDYAFVSNEFKRCGMKFQRKQLCTVRLGRKLIPGLKSYGLGNLSQHLNITIKNRHRAFGDAEATAKIFNLLLRVDKEKIIEQSLKEEIKQSILPPQLSRDILKGLPEETGVYYFKDERGKIVYIGKSTNIRQRVISHLSGDMHSEKYQRMKKYIYQIDYTVTGNELMALILESQEIKKWFPAFNSALRKKKYRYGIYKSENEDGYITLKVRMLNLDAEPFAFFTRRMWAEETLRQLAIDNGLCLKYCFLEKAEDGCQNYADDICKGACLDMESPEEYNPKVLAALAKYEFEKPDFVIIGEGRAPHESAVVCVEKGNFTGMGYVDSENAGYTLEQLKQVISLSAPHPDIHAIIRSYMKKRSKVMQVVFK